MTTLYGVMNNMREWVGPQFPNSTFQESGVLTPEEFVAAGDLLVFKCPTWGWASGNASAVRNILPADKQFLMTRNVPCVRRAVTMEYSGADEAIVDCGGDDGDDGWVSTHSSHQAEAVQELTFGGMGSRGAPAPFGFGQFGGQQQNQPQGQPSGDVDMGGDDDDIPDMDGFGADNLVEPYDSGAVAMTYDSSNILKTRTYDISITYDKYYQTPRVWLFGYDENGQPLTPEQVFEDISQDHARKTVTIESHPHLGIACASIHPCKHANVMKRIMDQMGANRLRVDQYLFMFLKFVSTIIPTIEYDFTIDM